MRINIQYIKDFLEIVLDINQPDFTFQHDKIRPLLDNDEKFNDFVFHFEILQDQDLIVGTVSDKDVVVRNVYVDGTSRISLRNHPMRLTADGHQFASDLNKPGIVDQLTTTFKDAGPKEVVKIVFSLTKKALDKKLEELTVDSE
ncbi:MAG: DUF2513 domain-containing protein [Candidatus Electrothrix sp. GM3_4]|nr:DUF2513 domain-containing protein [Candidatus Electrothrix sp. GM3_4]